MLKKLSGDDVLMTDGIDAMAGWTKRGGLTAMTRGHEEIL
jgi:hypothetical protein